MEKRLMGGIKCHLTSQDSLLISPSSGHSYFPGSVWRLLQGLKCGFSRILGCLWRMGSWCASWSWAGISCLVRPTSQMPRESSAFGHQLGANKSALCHSGSWPFRHRCAHLSWVTETAAQVACSEHFLSALWHLMLNSSTFYRRQNRDMPGI